MKYNLKLSLVFALLMAWTMPSWAGDNLVLTPAGCATVASILEAVATERKSFSYEQQLTVLDSMPDIPPPVTKLLKKHLYLIYKVYPQRKPEEISKAFFLECYEHNGDLNKLSADGTST